MIDVLIAVRQVCFCLQGLSDQLQEDHARFVKLALELSRTALQPLPAWLGIEPITNCCIEVGITLKKSGSKTVKIIALPNRRQNPTTSPSRK